MDGYIDELDNIITQWGEAYISLESLLLVILNKENIDLSKYSTNLTESELRSYIRNRKNNSLLNN
jgi:hypothetical protein